MINWLKRLLLREVNILIGIFMFVSSAVGGALLVKSYMYYGKNIGFVGSYINYINTPYYSSATTVKYLEEFNSIGGGIIVHYGGSKISTRTISIEEIDVPSDSGLLGRATPWMKHCSIYIRRGLSYKIYRETLIHEYLHCLGYLHVDIESDLMYPYQNGRDVEASITKYAKELEANVKRKKRLYE